MSKRGRFGALAGALLLTFAVANVAAAKPGFSIQVTKTASPMTVPASGGTVTFTVWAKNTGDAFFQVVNVSDSLAGCTLGAASGDDGNGKLDPGETWSWSCTVTGVTPGTTNTATVDACHDNGGCKEGTGESGADAHGTASVTITAAVPAVVVTAKPTVKATVLNTATVDSRTSSTDGTWLAIVALGILLASVVILTPRRSKSRS